jgi:predicted alpha/beta hydrolase family esterase
MSARGQILFLHSAGPQGRGEGSDRFLATLERELCTEYELRAPKMPDPDAPAFDSWRERLEPELRALGDGALLVGHSLGGSVLLKVLSEAGRFPAIAGLFLVATPFWSARGWKVDEFVLREDFAERLPEIPRVFLYHSRDDDTVPFDHLELYARALPHATVRPLDAFGHVFEAPCPALLSDIRACREPERRGND